MRFNLTKTGKLKVEHDELQAAVVEAFYAGRWDAKIFSVTNQKGTRKTSEQVRLARKLGLHKGVTDLCVVWRSADVLDGSDIVAIGITGYLEVKPPDRGLNKAQREWGDFCRKIGAPWAIISDSDQLPYFLDECWGVPRVYEWYVR